MKSTQDTFTFIFTLTPIAITIVKVETTDLEAAR